MIYICEINFKLINVMEPKELRIGNLLHLYNPESWENFINEVVKVESIDLEMTEKEKTIWKNSFGSLKLVSSKNQFNQFSEYAKPIPLTEQWLKKINWGGYIELSINSYFKIDKQGRLYYRSDYTGININHVHQLQNLYYALTQTELTFNK